MTDILNRIIAVVSGKGGVGKTSLATNIAAELASAGHRVLEMDLDPQGTAALVWRLPAMPAMYNVLNDDAQIQDLVAEVEPARWTIPGGKEGGSLHLLPGDNTTAAASIGLYMKRRPIGLLRELLEPLLEQGVYDFIVLDTPPSVHPLAPYVYAAAGMAIVPTDCGIEGLDGFLRTKETVEASSDSQMEIVAVVPDRIPHSTALHDRVISDLHERFGDMVVPPLMERDVWAKSAYMGKALGVTSRRSVAYREFKIVYRHIVRELRKRGIEA
ncbi:MAG TPA: ParA family protein [Aggregatilinea sp.]|uniref:ParA family protein n=1 Tax=Aggregatilinea sp. TaxID=2806333 RepID=UPI002CF6DA3F|nr:ParA family protein [Aggregatilinea sp.]HML22113.1 ParA family protein [Aggregatilinea sp.]